MSFGHGTGLTNIRAKFVVQLIQINAFQQYLDRFGTDPGFELIPISFLCFHILFVGQQLPPAHGGILGIKHNIAVKIEHFLHIFKRQIQQVADLARQAL